MDKELEYTIRDNFSKAIYKFNFEKVHKVMDYLDWYWWGDTHAPYLGRMIDAIEELFEVALADFKNDTVSCKTGGFTVTINPQGEVSIEFVVTESYSY